MNKNLIVLYADNWMLDHTYVQYDKLKKETDASKYNVVCAVKNNNYININKFENIFNFKTNIAYEDSRFNYDKIKILIELYKTTGYDNYDKYYLISSKTYYSGNWNELFNMLDNSNSDYLSPYVKDITYEADVLHNDGYYTSDVIGNAIIKSFNDGFVMFSNKALEFISKYNETDILKSNYKVGYSTLLYSKGFKLGSLSSYGNEDSVKFDEFSICTPETYSETTSFFQLNTIRKIVNINKSQLLFYKYFYDTIAGDIITKVESPDISVIIPVYNAEKTIADAIDSVIEQNDFTNYEIIVINDGSTDNTKNILTKYDNNKKVSYINMNHIGISNALNVGIRNSKGKYIVRMDADDISYNFRLKYQYDWMETHPDADIMSSSADVNNGTTAILNNVKAELSDFADGNKLIHPAVIMKRESIMNLPEMYESYYDGAEDYKLWINALSHGLNIYTDNKRVIMYNLNNRPRRAREVFVENCVHKIIDNILDDEYDDEGDLTAIITFKNEECEIEKTVANIRATAEKKIPIILINDGSEDNTDYEFVAKTYHCQYIRNTNSKGVAGARDEGVSNCHTKYFMLLDGHMRFTEFGWDVKISKICDDHPNSLLCSQTAVIWKKSNNEIIENECCDVNVRPFGAYIRNDQYTFSPNWSYNNIDDNLPIVKIPCVFGACYISSVDFWNKIGGLYGLKTWGQDEPLMSIKAWLAGGNVYLIRDFVVGHIYRESTPYSRNVASINSNYIWLNYLFCENDDQLNKYNDFLKNKFGDFGFNEAYKEFENRKDKLDKFKKHFIENIKVKTLDYFLNEINYKANSMQLDKDKEINGF